MSFSEKGNGEDSESMEAMNIENSQLENSLSSLSSNDMHHLNEFSQELILNPDMETEEMVVENQEEIEHEEEVETEEVATEDLEVIIDQSNKVDEHFSDLKISKLNMAVPPLRPLTIAPKPTKVPLTTVKAVGGQLGGQPLLFLQGVQGAGSGQTIKLVASQGQEIFTNIISRPLTIKPSFKTISTQGSNISLVQQKPVLMKKVVAANSKTVTKTVNSISKPTQHFMVVQKSDQQQLKLIQAQGNVLGVPAPTKTITLQQAQEMGLITSTKIAQPGHSTGKQSVLLAKNPQKSIKLIPQSNAPQILTTTELQNIPTKTVTLNQVKAPTKILPAVSNSINKGTQRLIFKTAAGSPTILPQGQILQVSAAQAMNSGQVHQINIPGKGMQYIKFVTSTADANTTTAGNVVKSSPIMTPTNIVLSEVKPISTLNRIVPKIHPKDKVPISPNSKTLTSTPLMVMPVQIPTTQSIQFQSKFTKVSIAPPASPQQKPAGSTKSSTGSNENTSPQSKEELDANGMRPRKPCNCNKSQCLKLYCDCFANGEFCYMCNCMNCFNNLENEDHRNRAIKACLERNPNAFRPKIGKAKDVVGDTAIRKHTKGCNCKRSGCLKNYCECYEAKIACSNNCKCFGCRNIEETIDKKSVRHLSEKATNTPACPAPLDSNGKNLGPFRQRRSSSSRKQTINFITDDVIEATCQCLLTISDNADESIQDEEVTKRLIIEEFGRCLTEIIDCSSNRSLS
ncbi:protein lin-54 homolog [Diabrotica virgifera virgifera]|uniref:Protein lin-54 homolog n=1 Tax=Diabrotica virgifera virgifera TaxID=50390 RepID=A0A6P7GIJ3_DIAVI|nr:protein lin-54 homolog [Diabrotica virgifera virgifera]